MDLKGKLKGLEDSLRIGRMDQRLIIALAVLGVGLIVVAGWLTFSDWRVRQSSGDVESEVKQAVSQLTQPIQALNRVMFDEQVQALAVRAIETPASKDDLLSYLKGRLPEITGVQVFDNDIEAIDGVELGANGYALLDALLTLQDNRFPQVQIHHIIEPPVMVDAIKIYNDSEPAGYLVVELDPAYVLSGFNPEYSRLGYIGLSQYNGRQKANMLQEFGDRTLAGEVPDRALIPGTNFRLEFPMRHLVTTLESRLLILMLLAGGLFLAAAVLMNKANKKLPITPPKVSPDPSKAAINPLDSGDQHFQELAENQAPSEQDSPQAVTEPEPEIPDPPMMHLRYDIAERHKKKEHEHQPVELSSSIFRAYDIRGIIDETLDAGIARKLGQAVGTVTLESDAGPLVVARDGRLSGPYLHEGMIEGVLSTGCDVLDIGAVPTGVLYYAAHELAKGSGVMITGSHNPPDYNGFKIMLGGDTLHGSEIFALYRRIVDSDFRLGQGTAEQKDVVPAYIERIKDDIQMERPLKVVIDCGNGIGGVCAADVLRAIGAEVLPLFDEVDGTFPNHHPDPSEPENLEDLIDAVRLMDADIGLALDGDADRLGVVTLAGEIIFPDRIMMLLAMDVLDRNPGATIMYDVKCTSQLAEVIKQAGGNPVMYKTGHSLIKAKMKEIGAPFAGEMSGHFFFKERWYGVDDGIYSAARLLEILAGAETPPEAILNALPTSFSTPELKVEMAEGENFAFMDTFRTRAFFEGARVSKIDGVRADFPKGFGLVRCSNTTPVLVLRFDAETEQELEHIKNCFRTEMLKVDRDLELPF